MSNELRDDLLRDHARLIVEDLLKNKGTTIIETGDQIAHTFCIFEGCGVFVPVPDRSYYELATPSNIQIESVRRSILRLLKTVSAQLHLETILMAIDTRWSF